MTLGYGFFYIGYFQHCALASQCIPLDEVEQASVKYCNFTKFRCVKISVPVDAAVIAQCISLIYGVFFISVKLNSRSPKTSKIKLH